MAGNYKLIYFDFRGRAETARMLFHLAGVKFEEKLVGLHDWPTMKDTTPFGGLPMLEVDGEMLWQGKAITRFLARRFGFAGKNDVDAARADAVVESTEDAFLGLIPAFKIQDLDQRAKILKEFFYDDYNEKLAKFEKMLKTNKSGPNFFVGDDLTWADLAVFNQMEMVETFGEDLTLNFDNLPLLKAHRNRVANHTAIAQYISTRKKDRKQSYFSRR